MNTAPSQDSVQLAYAGARSAVPAGAPCVVLQLGALVSAWAWGTGVVPEQTHALPLGIETLAQRYFLDARPSEAAVELGIEVVEEIVMPWHKRLPPQSVLVSSDPYVNHLAGVAGMPAQASWVLSTATVEALFNQWADEVLGGGARPPTMPTNGSFAATLLVVREVLHHLAFSGVLVQRSLAEPVT